MPLTKEKTEAEIAAERRGYIGGSDAGAVLGVSPYKSPLDVWSEKTGKIIPKDRSRLLPIKLGHKLEPIVAELFCEETGKRVRRVTETQVHPKYPFLRAQIDRRILGSDEILECKTASGYKAADWSGEDVPSEYIVQCLHQLMVTGAERCHIACLIGGNVDFVVKVIERDEQMIKDLEEQEVRFWNEFVLKGQMPPVMAMDDHSLLELFPKGEERPDPLLLPDFAAEMAERYKAIGTEKTGEIGKLMEEKAKLKAELCALLADSACGVSGKFEITWKNQALAPRIDLDAFHLEQPEMYAKYAKPAGSTRVLRVKDTTAKAKKGAK